MHTIARGSWPRLSGVATVKDRLREIGARLGFALALLCAAPPVGAQERLGAQELPGARLERVLLAFGRHPATERDAWDRRVCVGLSGVRNQRQAAALINRITMRVFEQGLEPGRPNCVPNVLVFVTPESARLAEQLASEYRGIANEGIYGEAWIDEGSLTQFVEGDSVVRWWHAPPPSTQRASQRARERSRVIAEAYVTETAAASEAPAMPREAFPRVLVVIDATRGEGISLDTLGDLAAMAALGQIRQDRLPATVDSILNRFRPPADGVTQTPVDSFTDWDRARLHGLYAAPAAEAPG